ncbi:MAG: M48 family metalloprotease [Oligoflexales bacterium]|nr:M48 family metalloprotease [Oligoflexales bacterium]
MKKVFNIVFPVLSFFSVSCIKPAGSGLKHDFGVTKRESVPLACEDKLDLPDQYSDKDEDSLFKAYIKKHMELITSKNPGTFAGDYGLNQFCINVERTSSINASASWDGTISILAGLLKVTDNDADFAGVIAHELAHVSMGHVSMTAVPKDLAGDRDYLIALGQLRIMMNDIVKKMKEIERVTIGMFTIQPSGSESRIKYLTDVSDAISKDMFYRVVYRNYSNIDYAGFINAEINKPGSKLAAERESVLREMAEPDRKKFEDLFKDYLIQISDSLKYNTRITEKSEALKKITTLAMGRERGANWEEQEADEVGYELYIRAGYDPSKYAMFFKTVENLMKKKEKEAEQSGSPVPEKVDLSLGVSGKSKFRSSVLGSFRKLVLEVAGGVESECIRGNLSHPDYCWRINDIENSENVSHRGDYSDLLKDSPKAVNVFGEMLNQLKEKYASYLTDEKSDASSDLQDKPSQIQFGKNR